MRTTVTIDEDVLSVARALAEQRHISLGRALSELARRGFQPPNDVGEQNGLPAFRVEKGAPAITNDDVRKALSDWP